MKKIETSRMEVFTVFSGGGAMFEDLKEFAKKKADTKGLYLQAYETILEAASETVEAINSDSEVLDLVKGCPFRVSSEFFSLGLMCDLKGFENGGYQFMSWDFPEPFRGWLTASNEMPHALVIDSEIKIALDSNLDRLKVITMERLKILAKRAFSESAKGKIQRYLNRF